MLSSPPSHSSGEISSGWEGVQISSGDGRFSRDDSTDTEPLKQLIFDTRARNPISEDLKLPWEKGIFSDIFSGSPIPSMLKPPCLPAIQHAPMPAPVETITCKKRKMHKIACSVVEVFRLTVNALIVL